jgi:4-hydroxymandelate oxidase
MSNVKAWQQWNLIPRVLQDLSLGHTRAKLVERECAWPVLIAPMAALGWVHAQGETGMALAAGSQGCGLVVSNQTNTPMHEVARALRTDAQAGPLCWQQQLSRSTVSAQLELAQAAERCGYEAVVLTIDAPVQGVRDTERRAGTRTPRPPLAHPSPHSPALPTSGLCQGLAANAPRWTEVQDFLHHSPLPVWIKGINHSDDALRALDQGARGVIVSNHGGRVLDTQAPTAHRLEVLAPTVRRHHPQASVWVDGGIRRGTDVFKALALGAQAVMVGRLALNAFAHSGALGVAQALRQLRDEFEATLTLCGCATLADIQPEHLERTWG